MPVTVRAPSWSLLLATVLLLSACGRTPQPTLEFEPCRLPGVEREARCAKLMVEADPLTPGQGSVELKLAVLPALARQALPDPVFVLAGGPGQSATRTAGLVASVLAALNHRRDLVFVDQRGTGGSTAFECKPDEGLREFDPQADAERLAACASAAPLAPKLLATWIAARDLDAVRAQLGADKINLWGASYGTRLALDYLRQFPKHVRSAVLDGVAPPDMRLPVAVAIDAEAALDRVISDCAADPACRRHYPQLGATTERVLAEAARGQTVKLADPLTGQVQEIRLSRELVAAALRVPLYVPALAAALPHAIERAGQGEWGPLAALAAGLGGPAMEGFATGMHYAVVCNEDAPRISSADRERALATRFGTAVLRTYDAACAALPSRAVPAEFYEIAARPVPVLILSGGRDPVTPPAQGEAVAQRLGQALHLVAPELGHGVSGQGCAPELIERFIKQASFEGLSGECLARLPAPLFFSPPRRP